MNKQQPNNRHREYILYFQSHVADRIKQAARAEKITEQEWIRRCVAQKLFETPAATFVQPVETVTA